MKRVVVFGAGLVAAPLIRYLLSHGYRVTVAALNVERAKELLRDHSLGTAIEFDLKNRHELKRLVADHELSVSLLPPPCHPIVAKECVAQRKPMVSTSYRRDDIMELDEDARAAGSLILMECGADPGIDHMSLMEMIERARAEGGEVVGLRSLCGGLPAPGSNDNPLGYKFSWSPKGVLSAGTRPAAWREKGKTIQNPEGELHKIASSFSIQELSLEHYPNFDSLSYESVYGIEGIQTLLRETLRYPGWCESIRGLAIAGWLDDEVRLSPQTTFRAHTAKSMGSDRLEPVLQERLQQEGLGDYVYQRMDWLGLLSDEPVGSEEITPLDALTNLASARMAFKNGERDMLIMHHALEVEIEGKNQVYEATLFDYGEPHGDSAMSRTVSYPAAIASRLILENKVEGAGVQIPVSRDLYHPILEELKGYGIEFRGWV